MDSKFKDYVNVTEDGGLKKKIIKEGTGKCPTKGQKVKVHYVGTFLNGKQFDKSDDPFEFNVGSQQVIKGWDIGVLGMKLNEKAEFWIRSDYAYGTRGAGGSIPPNTDLCFTVELIHI